MVVIYLVLVVHKIVEVITEGIVVQVSQGLLVTEDLLLDMVAEEVMVGMVEREAPIILEEEEVPPIFYQLQRASQIFKVIHFLTQ